MQGLPGSRFISLSWHDRTPTCHRLTHPHIAAHLSLVTDRDTTSHLLYDFTQKTPSLCTIAVGLNSTRSLFDLVLFRRDITCCRKQLPSITDNLISILLQIEQRTIRLSFWLGKFCSDNQYQTHTDTSVNSISLHMNTSCTNVSVIVMF